MSSFLLICFIAGAIGAMLQGIIGIGTGIIIVPFLTLMLPEYGYSPNQTMHIALATSMAAIALNSISALISHQRRGNLRWDLFKKIILFSVLGSGLGALAATSINAYYLEGFYAVFLLWVAWVMLFQQKAYQEQKETVVPLSGPKLASGGFGIGFIASLIGSGGGILMVPYLHKLKVNIRYAVGTSTLIGLPISLIGASAYSSASTASEMPYLIGYLHWPSLLAFSLSGLICAPLGVRMATKIPAHIVKMLFAVCIIVVALKMLWHLYSL